MSLLDYHLLELLYCKGKSSTQTPNQIYPMKSDFNPIRNSLCEYVTFTVRKGQLARTPDSGVNWSCRHSLFTLIPMLPSCFKLKLQDMHTYHRTCASTQTLASHFSDQVLLLYQIDGFSWLQCHAARAKVAYKPQTKYQFKRNQTAIELGA